LVPTLALFSCTANRFDASVTKAANGLASDALARCATTDARSAYAALLHTMNDAKIVTMQCIRRRDRKLATKLLAVKGEALMCWRDGCLRTALRALAARPLFGFVFRLDEGPLKRLRLVGTVSAPQ
jgi:hypothetical protein